MHLATEVGGVWNKWYIQTTNVPHNRLHNKQSHETVRLLLQLVSVSCSFHLTHCSTSNKRGTGTPSPYQKEPRFTEGIIKRYDIAVI